jgi:hypothetical protein
VVENGTKMNLTEPIHSLAAVDGETVLNMDNNVVCDEIGGVECFRVSLKIPFKMYLSFRVG